LVMVLPPQLSIQMVSAPLTEAHKVCLLMVIERETQSQVMELDMVLLPHLSIHMVDPAQTTELPKDFPVMDIMVMERDPQSQVMDLAVLVTLLFSKAVHTTMVPMATTSTMFMERGLLSQDTFMELTTVNSMFPDPTLAMVSMLPTLIEDCQELEIVPMKP